MASSRRGFLGTLMASIVGTAFVPSEVLWMPSPVADLPTIAPKSCLTLAAITEEAARLLQLRIALPVMGDMIIEKGKSQIGVTLSLPRELDERGLDVDRYIKPAVYALANRIKFERWKTFGELPLPPSVISAHRSTSSRVSVRAIHDYHAYDGESYLRLEAIGGV